MRRYNYYVIAMVYALGFHKGRGNRHGQRGEGNRGFSWQFIALQKSLRSHTAMLDCHANPSHNLKPRIPPFLI